MITFGNFRQAMYASARYLLDHGEIVDTTSWQGKTDDKFSTLEVVNYSFTCPVPNDLGILRESIRPNLPWADDHFEERVGGVPLNPGEQYKNWPYYKKDEFRTEGEKFTHTYMERFWSQHIFGIRYQYGDLNDVVNLLLRDPYTRQAYFPIWFPEDTGAVHGGRVPCSLGYHFLLRNDKLHIFYDIRSCDCLRHFQDDIYLACRLLHWVYANMELDNKFWRKVGLGNLIMHMFSFHIFKEDIPVLEYKLKGGLI